MTSGNLLQGKAIGEPAGRGAGRNEYTISLG